MQKTALDERLRSAKPNYITVDKDKIVSQVVQATYGMQQKRKSWWTTKKLILPIIPLAAVCAVGFTKLPELWVNNGSTRAYTGPTTHEMLVNGVKATGGLMTKNGPFIQAKHAISLPKDEVLYVQNRAATSNVSLKTKEVILMGIPFIRMNVIQKDNYAHSNMNYISDKEMFIPAKHAVALPESEIARNDKEQTVNTKEILIPGKQPLIRWDVIAPDNNANY